MNQGAQAPPNLATRRSGGAPSLFAKLVYNPCDYVVGTRGIDGRVFLIHLFRGCHTLHSFHVPFELALWKAIF
jgi:hypothetical protein